MEVVRVLPVSIGSRTTLTRGEGGGGGVERRGGGGGAGGGEEGMVGCWVLVVGLFRCTISKRRIAVSRRSFQFPSLMGKSLYMF